jgi:hypothetical protein
MSLLEPIPELLILGLFVGLFVYIFPSLAKIVWGCFVVVVILVTIAMIFHWTG